MTWRLVIVVAIIACSAPAARGPAGGAPTTPGLRLPDDAALQSFAEGWSGGGNPRASLGV